MDFNYILSAIYWRLAGEGTTYEDTFNEALFLLGIWSVLLSLVLVVVITYLAIKLKIMMDADQVSYPTPAPEEALFTARNEQWEKVIKHLESRNPSDWKMAIIEADTMLEDLLKRLGYRGDSLGERLKSVEPSDFLTLQDAWEAHKVRNKIAHQSGFILTQREVRKVLDRYERVFKEFNLL